MQLPNYEVCFRAIQSMKHSFPTRHGRRKRSWIARSEIGDDRL